MLNLIRAKIRFIYKLKSKLYHWPRKTLCCISESILKEILLIHNCSNVVKEYTKKSYKLFIEGLRSCARHVSVLQSRNLDHIFIERFTRALQSSHELLDRKVKYVHYSFMSHKNLEEILLKRDCGFIQHVCVKMANVERSHQLRAVRTRATYTIEEHLSVLETGWYFSLSDPTEAYLVTFNTRNLVADGSTHKRNWSL